MGKRSSALARSSVENKILHELLCYLSPFQEHLSKHIAYFHNLVIVCWLSQQPHHSVRWNLHDSSLHLSTVKLVIGGDIPWKHRLNQLPALRHQILQEVKELLLVEEELMEEEFVILIPNCHSWFLLDKSRNCIEIKMLLILFRFFIVEYPGKRRLPF